MNLYKIITPFILTVCLITACGTSQNSSDEAPAEFDASKTSSNITTKALAENDTINKGQQDKNKMTLTGQVLYQDFEGGFYGFIAKNGDKYQPIGLGKAYRQHGLVIQIEAHEMPDMASTQQFGKIIKVLSVKVIDDTKVKPSDQNDIM